MHLLKKKSTNRWACAVKTCVVQGSTIEATCTVLQIKRNVWKPVYQAHLLQVNKGMFFTKSKQLTIRHKDALCCQRPMLNWRWGGTVIWKWLFYLSLFFNHWLPESTKSEFHLFNLELANLGETGMGCGHSREPCVPKQPWPDALISNEVRGCKDCGCHTWQW